MSASEGLHSKSLQMDVVHVLAKLTEVRRASLEVPDCPHGFVNSPKER